MSNTTREGQDKYAPRQPLKPSLNKVRSAISNGSAIFNGIDHRSSWMRRLRDLIHDHISDLGGEDMISASEMILVRRSAMICLQLELMEAHWAHEREGEAGAKALLLYQQTTNTLRRTLEALGLKRRPRDVTPNLDEYIESKRGRPSSMAQDAECEDIADG